MLNREIANLRNDVKAAYAEGPETQADVLFRVRQAKALLDNIEKEAKANLEDRPGGFVVTGLLCVGTIVEKVDWRLDTKGLKKEFGEDWYNERCKQVFSRSIRTTALD